MRHYLMTTNEHFEAAVNSGTKTAQNPAQQAHAMGRSEPQAVTASHEKNPVFPGFAVPCDSMQCTNVEDGGHQ